MTTVKYIGLCAQGVGILMQSLLPSCRNRSRTPSSADLAECLGDYAPSAPMNPSSHLQDGMWLTNAAMAIAMGTPMNVP